MRTAHHASLKTSSASNTVNGASRLRINEPLKAETRERPKRISTGAAMPPEATIVSSQGRSPRLRLASFERPTTSR